MIVKIIETGAVKTLSITDVNGIDWTNDLIGNATTLSYNEDDQVIMSQDDFDWWTEYISNYEADQKEAADLASELDIDEAIIWDRYNEQHTCDYGDHHGIKQVVFEQVKEEYSK